MNTVSLSTNQLDTAIDAGCLAGGFQKIEFFTNEKRLQLKALPREIKELVVLQIFEDWTQEELLLAIGGGNPGDERLKGIMNISLLANKQVKSISAALI